MNIQGLILTKLWGKTQKLLTWKNIWVLHNQVKQFYKCVQSALCCYKNSENSWNSSVFKKYYFKMLLAPIAGCHSKRIAKEINQKNFQLSSSKTEFFTAVWSFDFFQTLFYFLHAFIRITAHAHTRISRGVEKKLIFSLILMKNPDLKSLWNPLPWIGLTLPNLTLPNLT